MASDTILHGALRVNKQKCKFFFEGVFVPELYNIDNTRTQGYKTFFMLNSAEHEIFSANKYENANTSCKYLQLLVTWDLLAGQSHAQLRRAWKHFITSGPVWNWICQHSCTCTYDERRYRITCATAQQPYHGFPFCLLSESFDTYSRPVDIWTDSEHVLINRIAGI